MALPADVFVIAGAAGAGKSTFADLLLPLLSPVPALLDKDTMYGSFVASALHQAGRADGEREGPWYDKHVKVHEYDGMTATASQIRALGCPVALCAPFTGRIFDVEAWSRWVAALGGQPVRLVWVRTDQRTVKQRLTQRGSRRDSEKLAGFAAFAARMRLGETPAVDYDEVDNRAGAPPLKQQAAALAERLTRG